MTADGAALAQLARHAAVEVPERPRLVAWVSPIETGDGLLELRATETHYPLRHPLIASAFRLVAHKLDGSHTVDDITTTDPDAIPPSTVLFLLKTLRAVGVLVDGDDFARVPPEARRLLDFFSQFDPNPAVVLARIAACSVRVAGSGPLTEQVEAELQAMGFTDVTIGRPSPAADLVVATGGEPAFADVNSTAAIEGVPWLRVALEGTYICLGPLTVPGETACLICLKARARANGREDARTPDAGLEPGPLVRLAAVQAALEAGRFAGGYAPPATFGQVQVLSARSPQVVSEPVPRNPRCPVCSPLRGDDQLGW